jgi:hypothetical protein
LHVALSLLTLDPGRMGGSETYVRGLLDAFAAGAGPDRVSVLAAPAAARTLHAGGPVTVVEVGGLDLGSARGRGSRRGRGGRPAPPAHGPDPARPGRAGSGP